MQNFVFKMSYFFDFLFLVEILKNFQMQIIIRVKLSVSKEISVYCINYKFRHIYFSIQFLILTEKLIYLKH